MRTTRIGFTKVFCFLGVFLLVLLAGCAGHLQIGQEGIVVDIRFNEKGALVGETNLPDGTILALHVMHPKSQWEHNQFVTVENGRFQTNALQRMMVSAQSEMTQIESPSGLYTISWGIVANTKCLALKGASAITIEQ